MADEVVEYELNMKDLLSGKIDEAGEHVEKFEHKFEGLKERALATLESLGIAFGAFEAVDFIKDSRKEFEELLHAQSQLRAGLESTGHSAGLAYEDITEYAEKFAHTTNYTKAQIEDMQSVLLTFPSVTKDTFEDANMAVLNLATRLKTDAANGALQLGKALQDPVAGLGALRREGVNVEELRQKFVHVTSTLERQKLIIHELGTEVAHSAEYAFDANPVARYEKTMEEMRETVGEVADKILGKFVPAMEEFANIMKDSVEWVKEHSVLMKELGTGVMIAVAAFSAYWIILKGVAITQAISVGWTYAQIASMYVLGDAYEGASAITVLLTAAQYGLNAAWTANPIGVVIMAVAGLVYLFIELYKHCEIVREIFTALGSFFVEWCRIVTDVFSALGKIIHGVMTMNWSEIKQGWNEGVTTIGDIGQRMGHAWTEGWNRGKEGFEDDHKPASLIPDGQKTFKAKDLGNGPAVKEPKTKATGSKNITINVSIHSLVDKFETNVTNIKESTAQLRKLIVDEMASAVNDFQVVADH